MTSQIATKRRVALHYGCSKRMTASYQSDVTADLTINFSADFSALSPKDLIFTNYNINL